MKKSILKRLVQHFDDDMSKNRFNWVGRYWQRGKKLLHIVVPMIEKYRGDWEAQIVFGVRHTEFSPEFYLGNDRPWVFGATRSSIKKPMGPPLPCSYLGRNADDFKEVADEIGNFALPYFLGLNTEAQCADFLAQEVRRKPGVNPVDTGFAELGFRILAGQMTPEEAVRRGLEQIKYWEEVTASMGGHLGPVVQQNRIRMVESLGAMRSCE